MTTKYTLQILGTAAAPALFAYPHLETDADAMTAASEMAKEFVGVRWFMGIRVAMATNWSVRSGSPIQSPARYSANDHAILSG